MREGRQVKPKLQETYRGIGGKVYGPCYVAYFKRARRHRHPRLIYLGKSNPSVEFVEWLAEQPEKKVLELARLAVRHLRTSLRLIAMKARRVGDARRTIARLLAAFPSLAPADTPRVSDLLKEVPKFARIVLGPWEAWFAERVLKKLLYRRSRDGRHRVPDVQLKLERWRLKRGK
ncbi:MAG: DUF1678 family protein [Euryarchaeota archaeon]